MSVNLVLQAARFGDLVQTRRLVLTLLERGELHLVVDSSMVRLAGLLYPGASVHGLHFHGSPTADLLKQNRQTCASLQALPVDTVYNCNFSGQTAALCRLFEPERIVGYRPVAGAQAGIRRSPWARLAFELSRMRARTPLNLVDFWAHFAPSPLEPARVSPDARPGGAGLGVVLAGRESRRSLPLPLLARLVESLCGLLDSPRVLLLGTRAEQPAARRLLRLLPVKLQALVEDLSGKTDWPGLFQVVQGLDALITPDTGTMHLATHLGVPVLAFFLSSAWCHETGPYGRGHVVWQTALPCSPCLESAPCPRQVACLRPLEDSRVLRSLAAMLWPEKKLDISLPQGLQIWQSALDALGGTYHLAHGVDIFAAERAALRLRLQEYLGLGPSWQATTDAHMQAGAGGQVSAHSSPEQAPESGLEAFFCRDSQWMLPPGRYC